MEYRTQLPTHAVTEISDKKLSGKERAEHRKFWEAWQAQGDARLAVEEARLAFVNAERAWINCRIDARMASHAGPECGCGQHAALLITARENRTQAEAALVEILAKSKKGG